MKKSIRDIPKKRGRPKTTGRGQGVLVRLQNDRLSALDAWILKQKNPQPSRPEAIRQLFEIGLGSVQIVRNQKRSDSPTARDLAAAQIDRLTDSNAPAGERESRKRRLLKGPEEFRELRVDRPKKKI